MIKEIITEEIEVVDLENKLNNNTYLKVKKIFGITFFSHRYTLKVIKPEEEDKPAVGFKTHQP